MAEVQDFLNGARARGKMTLEDHLTQAGYTKDRGKRRSIAFQAQRLIRPGAEFAYLVGEVIFPTERARGKAPSWAGSATPMQNRFPTPDFMDSPLIVSLAASLQGEGITETTKAAFEDNLPVIAKLNTKAQVAVNKMVSSLSTDNEQHRREAQFARSAMESMQKALEQVASSNQMLQRIVESQLLQNEGQAGTQGVAPSAGRPSSRTN